MTGGRRVRVSASVEADDVPGDRLGELGWIAAAGQVGGQPPELGRGGEAGELGEPGLGDLAAAVGAVLGRDGGLGGAFGDRRVDAAVAELGGDRGRVQPRSARPSATVSARAASSTRPTRSSRSSVSATAAASKPRSSSRCRSSARVRARLVSSRRAAAWAASADPARSPSSGASPRLHPPFPDRRPPSDHHRAAQSLSSSFAAPLGLVGSASRSGAGVGVGEADAELGLDLLLDLAGELGVVAEEVAGVLASLAELVAVVGEPGPRLLDETDIHADVEQAPSLEIPWP